MKSTESLAVFAIIATVVCSFIYFIILEKIKGNKNDQSQEQLINRYAWRKISGFLVLGLIPAILAGVVFGFTPWEAGLTFGGSARLWPWIAGASIFFIILNVFNSKNAGLRAMYPELRLKEWDLARLFIAVAGWVLYLTAYEYLFRGILLLSCLDAFGLWPAVTINLALYAALHLPKGMKEAIAAIPFGALICYLTIESRSILPAVFLHSLQAVSNELFCIYRNLDMEYNFFKRIQI
jgi:membrane protease YdiL (CAAX protease family)